MSKKLEEQRRDFLGYLDMMVLYWRRNENPCPSRLKPGDVETARMEGLVFSILVAIDGGASVGPYSLRPINEDAEEGEDLSDHELHSRWARGLHRK